MPKITNTFKIELEIETTTTTSLMQVTEQVAVIVSDLRASAWGQKYLREAKIKSVVEK